MDESILAGMAAIYDKAKGYTDGVEEIRILQQRGQYSVEATNEMQDAFVDLVNTVRDFILSQPSLQSSAYC